MKTNNRSLAASTIDAMRGLKKKQSVKLMYILARVSRVLQMNVSRLPENFESFASPVIIFGSFLNWRN